MIATKDIFSCCTVPCSRAKLVLFGAPLEAQDCVRSGAGFGPDAMRRTSQKMDTYSFYQNRDLRDCAVCDLGNISEVSSSASKMQAAIEHETQAIVSGGKIPLMLGGHPSVTPDAVRVLSRQYPKLHLFRFGAHAALQKPGQEGAVLSHCISRQCYEILGENRIHQFCVRSGSREEFQFAATHTEIHPFGFEWLQPAIDKTRQNQIPIYLSLNLDCLDPSLFPAAECPIVNGVSFLQLLEAIRIVCRGRVIGADVTGLIPAFDHGDACAQVAAQAIRELVLLLS